MNEWIFQTRRLRVRRALPTEADVAFLFGLWTEPQVMTFVGFPQGLRITREKVRKQLSEGTSEYDSRLLIVRASDQVVLGECKLGLPGEDSLSETDVKLRPEFWGQGYGSEIKQGLVDYLFEHTDCRGVKATPNKRNIASIKMQESVGAVPEGEEVFEFPTHMRDHTVDVPHYTYVVYRETWLQRRSQQGQQPG